MKLVLPIFFTLFVSSAVCKVISHANCNDVVAQECTVHSVRINPCHGAATNKRITCRIKRKRSATIDFDYTPDFAASNVNSEVLWKSDESGSSSEDSSVACPFTQCPLRKGKRNSFSQTLNTSFRASEYNVQWKLSNADKPEQFCCFTFKVKLTNK